MADAVQHSLRHMQENDLKAIIAYLRTVPVKQTQGQETPSYADAKKPNINLNDYEYNIADNSSDERYNVNMINGAGLYNSACAACHGINGEGAEDGAAPSLRKNRAVGSVYPNGVVMAIAQGIQREGADETVSMPAFAANTTMIHSAMDDKQIADVVNYVRGHFGNQTQTITAEDVQTIIAGGKQPFLIRNAANLAIIGVICAIIIVVAFIAVLIRRKRKVTV